MSTGLGVYVTHKRLKMCPYIIRVRNNLDILSLILSEFMNDGDSISLQHHKVTVHTHCMPQFNLFQTQTTVCKQRTWIWYSNLYLEVFSFSENIFSFWKMTSLQLREFWQSRKIITSYVCLSHWSFNKIYREIVQFFFIVLCFCPILYIELLLS